jgi:3-deoxy-D-manno-octulosonic-acid transferase
VFGPLTENFRQEVELLLQADGAVRVADRGELRVRLQQLLSDPQARRDLGARGQAMIMANRGATERTLEVVRGVLPANGSARERQHQ